jgi:FAD synthase
MVSSSRIRAAIGSGELAEAHEMLAACHAIDLREIVNRSSKGSVLRIPRSEIIQVLPPAGEYAVSSGSPAGNTSGTCRIDNDSLTLAAENCGSAVNVIFA